MQLTSNLLAELKLDPLCIDQVLLVGGSSQLNLVRTEASKIFGDEKVHLHPRPMLAIVEGAAIYSQYKLNATDSKEKKGDEGLEDILFTSAHDYFLKIPNDDIPPMCLAQKNMPLPFIKESEIVLQDKQQRLLQLQFLNLVNDNYEGIGRLWLSLNFPDHIEDKILSDDRPPTLLIKFIIDENNLVSVTCRLKEFPHFNVQHYISRGKVDEQLYLSLEQDIRMANRAPEHWIKIDYQERAISIVEDINNSLHRQTEVVNIDRQQRAERKLKTARELCQKKASLFPNIWYFEELHDFCCNGKPESRELLKELGKQLKSLKKANLEGEADMLIKMREDLMASFHQHFPDHVYQFNYLDTLERGGITQYAQRSRRNSQFNVSKLQFS